MASKDIQNIGVEFGNWKLVPLDSNNWELCHWHVTKDTAKARANGTAGKLRWHRLGRYYQYDTIHLALEYAADAEVKSVGESARVDLLYALNLHRKTLEEFRTAFWQGHASR